jgi:hypothetical protein
VPFLLVLALVVGVATACISAGVAVGNYVAATRDSTVAADARLTAIEKELGEIRAVLGYQRRVDVPRKSRTR